jgi:hypothetical protein
MKTQEINVLIDKFYEGNLTSEEELLLNELLKDNLEEKYNYVRVQLQIMNNFFDSEDSLDDSFDEKVLLEISKTNPVAKKRYSIQRILSGVAATALILISILVVTSVLNTKEAYGTINDSDVAFAETKKILQKVSTNINKGVKPVTKTVKKAEEGLNNTSKVKKIKKLNNAGLLLKSMNKVTVKLGK